LGQLPDIERLPATQVRVLLTARSGVMRDLVRAASGKHQESVRHFCGNTQVPNQRWNEQPVPGSTPDNVRMRETTRVDAGALTLALN
jgi:hypothetical protein